MLPSKRLMTQTGVAVRSGRGEPKVAPLVVPGPTAPTPVQEGSEPLSQSLRQKSRTELPPIGKLCAAPFKPMSRSPPTPRATVVSRSSLGPPPGFGGQTPAGSDVVVEAEVVVVRVVVVGECVERSVAGALGRSARPTLGLYTAR